MASKSQAASRAKPRPSRRSAFVPRLLVRTAIIGVVPACALASAGCSSDSNPGPSTQDSGYLGVAAVAYPAYETGVPDTKYDGTGDAPADGASDADAPADVFGVAAVAYPAYETGAG